MNQQQARAHNAGRTHVTEDGAVRLPFVGSAEGLVAMPSFPHKKLPPALASAFTPEEWAEHVHGTFASLAYQYSNLYCSAFAPIYPCLCYLPTWFGADGTPGNCSDARDCVNCVGAHNRSIDEQVSAACAELNRRFAGQAHFALEVDVLGWMAGAQSSTPSGHKLRYLAIRVSEALAAMPKMPEMERDVEAAANASLTRIAR